VRLQCTRTGGASFLAPESACALCTPACALHEVALRHMEMGRIGRLKGRQKWLYETCRDYFAGDYDKRDSPPPAVLAHGRAGTGESGVVECVMTGVADDNTLRVASNDIDALQRHGVTFSLLRKTGLRSPAHCMRGPDVSESGDSRRMSGPVMSAIIGGCPDIAPCHIARLHMSCQQAMRGDEPFGGTPTLLAGGRREDDRSTNRPQSIRQRV